MLSNNFSKSIDVINSFSLGFNGQFSLESSNDFSFYNEEPLPFILQIFDEFNIKFVIRENEIYGYKEIGFMGLDENPKDAHMFFKICYSKENELLFRRFGNNLNNIPKLTFTSYPYWIDSIEKQVTGFIETGCEKKDKEKIVFLKPTTNIYDVKSEEFPKPFIQLMYLTCEDISHELEKIKNFGNRSPVISKLVYLIYNHSDKPFLIHYNPFMMDIISVKAIYEKNNSENMRLILRLEPDEDDYDDY
jgi:hypothetical protein